MYQAGKFFLACLMLMFASVALGLNDINRCGTIRENKTVYSEFFGANNGHDLLQLEITTKTGSGFTWAQLLADIKKTNPVHPWLWCSLHIAGVAEPIDCMLEKRGDWAMDSPLPSLKVKFTNENVTYKGMDRLLINKHPHDDTRVRNKLSFELLQQVPEMASVFTQFAQLKVDGENYGIYTVLEDIRKDYLKVHDMKKDSFMYKANSVTWNLGEDLYVKATTDPKYNETLMEAYNWDVRGESNHTVLLKAYNDVFDPAQDSLDVMSNDFNADNFAAWLAFMYLTAQNDMIFNNFAIWAPEPSKKCAWPTPIYMMAWDNDGAWYDPDWAGDNIGGTKPLWWVGPQYLWQMRIVKRFLQVDDFVRLFETKMKFQIDNILSAPKIQALIEQYKKIVRPHLLVSPDKDNLCCNTPTTNINTWEENIDVLSTIPQNRHNEWTTFVNRPMPVNIKFAYNSDKSSIMFYWDKSFVLYHKSFHYEFDIASDEGFDTKVYPTSGVHTTTDTFVSIPVSSLPANTVLYYRVIVRNDASPDVNYMTAFQSLTVEDYEPTGGFGIQKLTTPATAPAVGDATTPSISAANTATVTEWDGSVYHYATLDNISPDAGNTECVDTPRNIPTGWFIALDNRQTRAHVGKMNKKWGNADLVLASGSRVSNTGGVVDGFGELAQHLVAAPTPSGSGYAWTANCSYPNLAGTKVLTTINRILLTDNVTLAAIQPTVAPTLPPTPPKETTAAPTGKITAGPQPSGSHPTSTNSPSNGGQTTDKGTNTPDGQTGNSAATTTLSVMCVVALTFVAMLF